MWVCTNRRGKSRLKPLMVAPVLRGFAQGKWYLDKDWKKEKVHHVDLRPKEVLGKGHITHKVSHGH